jgi:hypothetical protein
MILKNALALVVTIGLGIPAQAAMQPAPVEKSPSAVILVYGGCGIYGHRGPYGGCRPGGQAGGYWAGRPCPPGFHLGPYGRRCWAN